MCISVTIFLYVAYRKRGKKNQIICFHEQFVLNITDLLSSGYTLSPTSPG